MIGIIPCAGSATRIHGIPKYLLPVPGGYLLDIIIRRMGIEGVHPVIGANRFNSGLIKEYAPTASIYLPENYATMSQTVIGSPSFTKEAPCLFAMPDTFIEDEDTYVKLTDALADGADIAVALFHPRVGQHKRAGMCTVLGNQVQEVVDKPANKMHYTHLWGALAWKPVFWQHMRPEDPHVGYALPRAIAAGLDVRAVKCEGGYWDCGVFNEYSELIVHLHGVKNSFEMSNVVEIIR